MENHGRTLQLMVRDIFTSGMYDRCEPAILYKFMMLNLCLSLGTPFVLGFGLFDIYRNIQPLGYIITSVGIICAASFYFLRRTRDYRAVGNLVVFVIFWMFLYLLATGGSGNSGILWYYSFPPIALFLLGFRTGSVVVGASLLASGIILFWPGTPYLAASYTPDMKMRFIPSVVVLWAITSLFEHVTAAALTIEIKNSELRKHIEELETAEQARRESEEEFRNVSSQFNALLDAIPDNIFLMSPDLKMLWVNAAAAAGVNRRAEDLVGSHCYPLWHKSDTPCDPCPALRSFSSGQPASDIVTTFDGRSIELRTIPVKKEDAVVSVIKVARDITEQRSLEEQLRHSQKMESVGTLAGGIAHDFNNILSAIIGYGDIVLMKMAKDDLLRPPIEHIRAAADKAAYLTQGLLAFSRKQMSNRRQVDLNEHIRKSEHFFRTAIGAEIRFSIALHEHPIPVHADPNQIEQVLMNLITNARDAMPTGGELTIATDSIMLDEEFPKLHGYGNPGHYGVITVSDSGSGMDAETRRRIFEPFFTTKEVGKGTGLGLSIIYGIMKQHDGFINVYSEPGEGTVFRAYLPMVRPGVHNTTGCEEAAYPAGGSETVLLAEDNEMLRQLAESVLTEFGYDVIAAVDGGEAVEKFMENRDRIRLLISDLVMPKKNGQQVYDDIRKVCPAIKAIFVSGYSPEIIRNKISPGTDVAILYKPLSPLDLLRKVRSVLDEGMV